MERKILELVAKRGTGEVEKLLAAMSDEDQDKSLSAGNKMVRMCRNHGVGLRDFLDLTMEAAGDASGYEVALMTLNLPTRSNFKQGIALEAAGETFQTRVGTRVLFNEVISDVMRWSTRQDNIENVQDLLAGSRTVAGVEMTKKVTLDDGGEDGRKTRMVAEGGRIPVRSITATETAVKFWKHGSAIRTTYEFNRRARLDAITPYLARISRELEQSKTALATQIMINGDGNGNAAPVVKQADLAPTGAETNTLGEIQWQRFFFWMIEQAKAGTPIDTVAMNYDGVYQWSQMFANSNNNVTSIRDALSSVGVEVNRNPIFDQTITPVLSSTMDAGKLLGFSRAETLEELVEANSNIEEESRETLNQTITVTKTENTGYHLLFDDTRSVYDYTTP